MRRTLRLIPWLGPCVEVYHSKSKKARRIFDILIFARSQKYKNRVFVNISAMYSSVAFIIELKEPQKATIALMSSSIYKPPAPPFEEELEGFVIEPEEPNEPYMFVEQMPEFSGGDKALSQFLKKNTRYPESAKNANIQGYVIISVVIEKDGSIGDVKIIRGLCESCDKEAIRVVKSMPAWIPGQHHGVNVAVIYTIPIRFRVEQ